MKEFLEGFNIFELSLMGVAAVSFLVQMYYYLASYSRIPGFRQKVDNDVTPGISVVVIVEDDIDYLTDTLPKLMEQDYEKFEVVVVDNGSSVDFIETLKVMCMRYPNLRTTRITPDIKFTYRRKFALNVGVKACTYPNIVFTETYTYPSSSKWLSLMAKGFSTGDVVIGYSGLESRKGFANKMMRCGRLMMSVRYLSSAIGGNPYRAISKNMGFTSKLYFDNKGYNHLDLSIGDDDLFIRKIARKGNTSVVLNPNAAVRHQFYGGLSRWFSERKFYSYTYRFYPAGVRFSIFMELFSRILFYAAAITLIALQVPVVWIVAAGLLVLRLFVVLMLLFRICRRLGEKGLMKAFVLHDLVSPLYEAALSVSRTLRPSKGVWN